MFRHYQIRHSRHFFFHASSTEKPATNRTVSNNSNAQFSGVHTVQLYRDSGFRSGRQCISVCDPVPETHLHSGTISGSMSRDQRDHSICTAETGCTACAQLIVSGLASDSPMYLIFPSSTSFLSSPTYSNLSAANPDRNSSHRR